MAKKLSEYKRCRDCGELVADVENCANCANRASPLSITRRNFGEDKKRGAPTLDMIEGNKDWWGQ